MLVSQLLGFDASPFEELLTTCVKQADALQQAAEDIYRRGTRPLADNWQDQYAEAARADLKRSATTCEILAMRLRGAVSILDGFLTATGVQQTELRAAVASARFHACTVADDGRVFAADPADVGQQQAAEGLAPLIHGVLVDATAIDDDMAHRLLNLMADPDDMDADGDVDDDDLAAVRNQTLDGTAQAGLDAMREAMPVGSSAAEQYAWWVGLSDQQRQEYLLALPTVVYEMAGTPADVKRDLEGNDGYDRMVVVQYALDNVDNTSLDVFENNCATFVSDTLEAAGVGSTGFPKFDDDAWTTWRAGDLTYSRSWYNAETQQDFFLGHGGQQITRSQVQPGDVIYWEQSGMNPDLPRGESHHAAIVTAVMPNGDILYTQHSDPYDNVSLDGRQPHNDVTEGDQNLIFVRPKETW